MGIEADLKTKNIEDYYQKLHLNMLFTSNWLEQKMMGIFKDNGITSHQFNVLRILRGNKGEPMPACAIQERMISRNSNVTRIVEKLLQKNYVTKKFNDQNRRMIEIKITTEGLELLSSLDNKIASMHHQIMDNLSEEEAIIVSNLLDKMRENK